MYWRKLVAILIAAWVVACVAPGHHGAPDGGPSAVSTATAPAVPEVAPDAGPKRRHTPSEAMIGGPPLPGVLECTTAADKAELMACLGRVAAGLAPVTPTEAGAHLYGEAPSPRSCPACLIPAWYVNPSTGLDSNTCVTSGSPCKTFAELRARWGGYEPVLAQATTVNFLADTTEWITWRPIIVTGGSATILGALTQTATGTLGAVTAKLRSRMPNPLLQADLTTNATGSQGLMVVNSTHASVSWVDSLSSTVATLLQPMTSNVPTFATFETEVDTTTTGDSYTLQRPTKVALAAFEPTVAKGVGGGSLEGYFAFLAHVWIPDPSGTIGSTYTNFNHLVRLTENRIDTYVVYTDTGAGFDGALQNNFIAGTGIFPEVGVQGGSFNSIPQSGYGLTLSGIADLDVIIHGGAAVSPGGFSFANTYGSIYCDTSGGTGFVVVADKLNVIGDILSGVLYGSCKLIAEGSAMVTYNPPATATFIGTTSLAFMSLPTNSPSAWANTVDTSVTPHAPIGPRTLSPTQLATSIASGGLGDLAISDFGGVFTGRQQTSSAPSAYVAPIANGGTGLDAGCEAGTLLEGAGANSPYACQLCPNGQTMVSNGNAYACTTVGAGSASCPINLASCVTSTLAASNGGTGRPIMAANAVVVAEGASPFDAVGPGASGVPLLGQGAGSDPAFSALSLAGPGAAGLLPITRGGFGVDTTTCANNTGSFPFAASGSWSCLPPGTRKDVLTVDNSTGLPTYDPVDLSGTNTALMNTLGTPSGGTGVASPTAHALQVAEGASPFVGVGPGASGVPLLGQGASSDPAFGAVSLSGPGVSGVLPITAGGFGVDTTACANHTGAFPIGAAGTWSCLPASATRGTVLTIDPSSGLPTYDQPSQGIQVNNGSIVMSSGCCCYQPASITLNTGTSAVVRISATLSSNDTIPYDPVTWGIGVNTATCCTVTYTAFIPSTTTFGGSTVIEYVSLIRKITGLTPGSNQFNALFCPNSNFASAAPAVNADLEVDP